jgi:hypothetical protein
MPPGVNWSTTGQSSVGCPIASQITGRDAPTFPLRSTAEWPTTIPDSLIAVAYVSKPPGKGSKATIR